MLDSTDRIVANLGVTNFGQLIEVNGFRGVFLGVTIHEVDPPYIALTLQGSDPGGPTVTHVRMTMPVKVVC